MPDVAGTGRNQAVGAARGSGSAASGVGSQSTVVGSRLASGGGGPRHATAAPVYVISVAAELAGVHPQTLRVYERKGLLDPSRTSGGSRRFSERDLARLRRIQDLTAAGLNLEGVRRVLELETELERLRADLERARADALEAIERIHRHYRRDLVPFDPSPVPYNPARRRGI
ncbi:MAG TPA: MerR family transcriptional regulator [Acidimicrobiales bacterium]|nr:MerR family transcriptional regulator [Acidimicrobiales bacterium]